MSDDRQRRRSPMRHVADQLDALKRRLEDAAYGPDADPSHPVTHEAREAVNDLARLTDALDMLG